VSVNSSSDVTPAGGDTKGRWALNLPYLWAGTSRIQLKGGPPTWHPTSHFVGYAGLARTLLAMSGWSGVWDGVFAYGMCVTLAMITGRLIQISTSERVPRICSATLGLMGFALGAVSGEVVHRHATAGVWAALVVPLGAAALVITVNLVGELLICWFPARVPVGTEIGPSRPPRGRFRRIGWTADPV
jgi:hypothetical protein